MLLKQTGELAPANEPWRLIEDAIADLKKQEKVKSVCINMDYWHHVRYGSDGELCIQCLAGCVMSRRLGLDTGTRARPEGFPDEVRDRLEALELFRTGEVARAYRKLGIKRPAGVSARRTIPSYENNPAMFKFHMLYLADDLKEAHNGEPAELDVIY